MAKYTLESGYRKSRAKLFSVILLFFFLIFSGISGILWQLRLKTPPENADHVAVLTTQPNTRLTAELPWPDYGQAAYGVDKGKKVAVSSEDKKVVPIASLTKVITGN